MTPETSTFKAGVPNIKPRCSIEADIEITVLDKKLSMLHASEVSSCLRLNDLLVVTNVLCIYMYSISIRLILMVDTVT